MPSFLSKVLRRKRDDREGSASEEARPSEQRKEKQRSPPSSAREAKAQPKQLDLPQLSLNLFDDTTPALDDTPLLLPEHAIAAQRLKPAEVLRLVRASSQSLTARGVDTLGIMHPHWHSASPDTQRRLISLFIHSLTAPDSSAALHSFNSEFQSTRSPHDIAAVLRWGLRHLLLEHDRFGSDKDWYSSFFNSERQAGHPPKAFSQTLTPLLPKSHSDLLKEVLALFSSFASHAETNSTSGSKLSKVFGLWLLESPRFVPSETWQTFYSRWETAGRQLEHLFLAHIRDEAAGTRIPTRLLELVKQYPYSTGPSSELLLARPKFSTRSHDALLVRVETELAIGATVPDSAVHPLRVIAEALTGEDEGGNLDSLWKSLVDASNTGNGAPLSRLFSDETIRFLSMLAEDQNPQIDAAFKHPTADLLPSPVSQAADKRLSFTLSEFTSDIKARVLEASLPPSDTDWNVFSSGGFGSSAPITPLASTLLSAPDSAAPKGSSKNRVSKAPSFTKLSETRPFGYNASFLTSKILSKELVELDEAFVEFWSDALLDPIMPRTPSFVVCELRSPIPVEDGATKAIYWVVIEHAFRVKRPPTPTPVPTTPSTDNLPRGRPSSVTSASKKRFMFWTPSKSRSMASIGSDISTTKGGKDKISKGVKVSELGEVLGEETAEPPARSHSGLTLKSDKRSSKRASAISKKSVDSAVPLASPVVAAIPDVASQVAPAAPVISKEEVEEPAEIAKEDVPQEPPSNGVAFSPAVESSPVDTPSGTITPKAEEKAEDAVVVEPTSDPIPQEAQKEEETPAAPVAEIIDGRPGDAKEETPTVSADPVEAVENDSTPAPTPLKDDTPTTVAKAESDIDAEASADLTADNEPQPTEPSTSTTAPADAEEKEEEEEEEKNGAAQTSISVEENGQHPEKPVAAAVA